MYVTNKLIDFLNTAKFLSNSTIILTDVEKVIFSASDNDNDFLDKYISNSLKQILNLFKYDISTVDYINTSLDIVVPIILNDDISRYMSQIILPILHNNIVVGLLIFITNNRKYLPSNLRFAKTTQHFTEIFSTKQYL